MLAALANVLEAALDAQVRVMALDLFYLLVKQVKVVDDLAQIQLIYSMQVVAQDLVGTLDLPVERTLAPPGPPLSPSPPSCSSHSASLSGERPVSNSPQLDLPGTPHRCISE